MSAPATTAYACVTCLTAAVTLKQAGIPEPFAIGSGLATAVGIALALDPPNPRTPTRFIGTVAVILVLAAATVRALREGVTVDVTLFLEGASDALGHGANPYSAVFRDMYDPALSALFYGPGVVSNGILTYGFPYPPLIAITARLGGWLGDVRFAGVIALGTSSLLLLLHSRTPWARAAAVTLVCTPGVGLILAVGWTETISVLLLAGVVLAVHRRHFATAAVLFGLLLVSKQYFAILWPLSWLLRPFATRRRVLLAATSAVLTTVPFVLWDPDRFWRSVVEWQFVQPYRADSSSLTVVLLEHLGVQPPSWLGPLALAVGFAAALALALRLAPGAASFSLGIGLSLGTMVLLSKQAFLNYYLLVGAALLIAGWGMCEGRGDTRQETASPRAINEHDHRNEPRILEVPGN